MEKSYETNISVRLNDKELTALFNQLIQEIKIMQEIDNKEFEKRLKEKIENLSIALKEHKQKAKFENYGIIGVELYTLIRDWKIRAFVKEKIGENILPEENSIKESIKDSVKEFIRMRYLI